MNSDSLKLEIDGSIPGIHVKLGANTTQAESVLAGEKYCQRAVLIASLFKKRDDPTS